MWRVYIIYYLYNTSTSTQPVQCPTGRISVPHPPSHCRGFSKKVPKMKQKNRVWRKKNFKSWKQMEDTNQCIQRPWLKWLKLHHVQVIQNTICPCICCPLIAVACLTKVIEVLGTWGLQTNWCSHKIRRATGPGLKILQRIECPTSEFFAQLCSCTENRYTNIIRIYYHSATYHVIINHHIIIHYSTAGGWHLAYFILLIIHQALSIRSGGGFQPTVSRVQLFIYHMSICLIHKAFLVIFEFVIVSTTCVKMLQ